MSRRKGFRCFECDAKADHAHHVVPHSRGGTRTIPLCEPCHGLVHDKDFSNLSELTKLGIERARANGKQIGRPTISERKKQRILELAAQGLTSREIARKVRVAKATVLIYWGKRENT